eukprot:TRINITY_DN7614_c0_g1_i3.p1 TRINITY_DN7614_c0_g1~~TRINITY_DN7614_c0_g1_i3.p1  ORF type:complete len:213 (-),score=81.01 TRINITY_DN7614_c0_g1_i3:182-820(-)
MCIRDRYDTNHDEKLDGGEMARRAAAQEQAAADRERMDTNKDEAVDRPEFIAGGRTKEEFDRYDTNHDLKLDAGEMEARAADVVEQREAAAAARSPLLPSGVDDIFAELQHVQQALVNINHDHKQLAIDLSKKGRSTSLRNKHMLKPSRMGLLQLRLFPDELNPELSELKTALIVAEAEKKDQRLAALKVCLMPKQVSGLQSVLEICQGSSN